MSNKKLIEMLQKEYEKDFAAVERYKNEISEKGFSGIVWYGEDLGNAEARLGFLKRLLKLSDEKDFLEVLSEIKKNAVLHLCGGGITSREEGPWKHRSSSYIANLEVQIQANAARFEYQIAETLLLMSKDGK